MAQDSKKSFDYAQEVSNKIIEAIESGTAPWMQPWRAGEAINQIARNPITNNPYRGINAMHLMVEGMKQGYSDPRWLTYKQANTLNAQVRKGEKSTLVQYWKFEEKVDKLDEHGKVVMGKDGKAEKETIKLQNPKVFFARVFNAQQIENMPKLELQEPLDFKPNKVAEDILKKSGATINHQNGERAFYQVNKDEITLPLKEQFINEEAYYSTALHELGHWSGHSSRLNRDLSGSFGSESYAKEELKAEIFSFMLSSKLGIAFDPANHYAYVESWVKNLKDDKHEIFRASRDAEKISSYVMDFQKDKSLNEGSKVEMFSVDMDKLQSNKTEILNPSQAKYLIENFGIKQVVTFSEENSFTKINIDNKELVLFQKKEGNGEIHSAINKSSEWKSDFFDNKDYHPKDAKFVNDKDEMISFKENHLLIELKDNLDKGLSHADDLNYTVALAKNTKVDDLKECINWMESQLRNMDKKSEVFSTIKSLKKSYENTPHLVKDRNDKVSDAINSHLDADKKYYQNKIQPKLEKDTYLYVPYKEKEEAKRAGAKWDKESKSWYAPKGMVEEPLEKWSLSMVKNNLPTLETTGNYEDDFVAELNARGFEVETLQTDGRIRNVKIEGNKGSQKSGAYAVFTDGKPVLWFKNHKTGETGSIAHKGSSFKAGASKEEIRKYHEINRLKLLQNRKDIEEMHKEVSSTLEEEYKSAKVETSHPYLKSKGIDEGKGNFKIDKRGNLFIPFRNAEGTIQTAQRIPKHSQEGKFPKFFEKGGQKSGNFALIGTTTMDKVTKFALCEGYATGETVYKALNIPVVVTGDAGNLQKVAQNIIDHSKDAKLKIIIVADNDQHREDNPGMTKAKATLNHIKGSVEKVALVKPTFTDKDKQSMKNPSDFNDLEALKGIDSAKRQMISQLNVQNTMSKPKNTQQEKKREEKVSQSPEYSLLR